MAKKIQAEQAIPGRFYIIKGNSSLFMCIGEDMHGMKMFHQVGGDHTMGVYQEKVKPVNVFAFSK